MDAKFLKEAPKLMQQLYIAIIKITSSQHIQLYKILNVSSKISTEKRELQIFF